MNEKSRIDNVSDYTEGNASGTESGKPVWKELYSGFRGKRWKSELEKLSEKTGMGFPDVCRYIGAEPSEQPGFYKKMPKKRETFIGIGMAYKLPLDIINRWLAQYGAKKKLYIKDISSDLIWIYLITVNNNDRESDTNYYGLYDSCRKAVGEIYNDVWNDIMSDDVDTVILESGIKKITYDENLAGLRSFVVENIDAFKTAYVKPRTMLYEYMEKILEVKNMQDDRRWTLSSLRGYLDDSMINYLSGSRTTINVMDGSRSGITSGIKHIPKSKRAHISLCLALGMTAPEIDRYLDMMGYSPLDGTDTDEGILLRMLEQWDSGHPQQAEFKEKYLSLGDNTGSGMEPEAQDEAVEQMLGLRLDLKAMYEQKMEKLQEEGVSERGYEKFPYYNE